MSIDALFQRPNALPVAPRVVQELIASFEDDDVSFEEIARKLSADPVLSAKLLRLANSAYFHVSRSVETVDGAVRMLGFVTVRTLAISSGLVNGFKSAPGLDLKQFWRYSLHTAVGAKWLATQAEANADMAFTVGMMNAIGQLVIHSGAPEEAQKLDLAVNVLDANRFGAEQAALGYDYAEVGGELAARWKFPDAFSAAIHALPDPLKKEPFDRIAGIVYLAAWVARANENMQGLGAVRAGYPMEVMEELGLARDTISEKMPPLDELARGLEELIS